MAGKISDVSNFGHEKLTTIKFSDTLLSKNKNVRNSLFLMYNTILYCFCTNTHAVTFRL